MMEMKEKKKRASAFLKDGGQLIFFPDLNKAKRLEVWLRGLYWKPVLWTLDVKITVRMTNQQMSKEQIRVYLIGLDK